MALPQVKQDATEARLAATNRPAKGAAWAETARDAALARVRSMGLPHRRDEYWKFTTPDSLVQPDAPVAAAHASDETDTFDAVDRLQIVFVDGVFDASASDDLVLEGVQIERLADAVSTDIHWAKDAYGVLEQRGQDPVARPL